MRLKGRKFLFDFEAAEAAFVLPDDERVKFYRLYKDHEKSRRECKAACTAAAVYREISSQNLAKEGKIAKIVHYSVDYLSYNQCVAIVNMMAETDPNS